MSRRVISRVAMSLSTSGVGDAGCGVSERGTRFSRTVPSPPTGSNRRSCITCHRRKTKCDKTLPCSGCRKLEFECTYPISRRQQRARAESQAALKSRVENLESLVHDLRSHVCNEDPQDTNLSSAIEEDGAEVGTEVASRDLGRLVGDEGQSRYMENSFWAMLSEKVDNIRSLLDHSSADEDGEQDYSEAQTARDELSSGRTHQGFTFGFSSLLGSLSGFHPSGSRILFLWNIFASNVDPLVRLLHKPGMQRELIKVTENRGNELSKPLEALLFAIYFASVTSMAAEDCRISFQEERHIMLDRYRFAVQQALARANFLSSRSLVTLQALLIYLACERGSEDSTLVWAMTGVAVRISQSLGLHRDGTVFNLSPFKTEMRRRAWWQLCLLDVRTAENHGSNQDIAQRNFDTRTPLNVEDTVLDPNLTETPVQNPGLTEMTLSLIRYEIITVLRRLRSQSYAPGNITYTPASEEIDRSTEECKKRVQEKYLQYCDPRIPLHSFMMIVARMMLARMWINVHHPLQLGLAAGSIPEKTREHIFNVALEIVRAWLCLDTEKNVRQWRWAFQNYIPWQALAFILSELCVRTRGTIVDSAWVTARDAFNNWTDITTNKTQNMLWIRMKKLLVMAERARASAATQTTSAPILSVPLNHQPQSADIWSLSENMTSGAEAFPGLGDQQNPLYAAATNPGPLIEGRSLLDRDPHAYRWLSIDEDFMGVGTDDINGHPFDMVRWASTSVENDATMDNAALFDEFDNWW